MPTVLMMTPKLITQPKSPTAVKEIWLIIQVVPSKQKKHRGNANQGNHTIADASDLSGSSGLLFRSPPR
ncbi:hypothetical protein GCM10025776_02190 [Corallincola platygyrae]